MTAANRIAEIFDAPIDITDGPRPEPSPRGRMDPGGRMDPRGRMDASGLLEFDDVGFRFPDSDTWVLRHVTLTVEPGETLALVGATGSGKSALAALLPRLYDVTEGSIRIGGIDIRDVPLEVLRGEVAVAFEDPTLFSMSVAENLTLGRSRGDPATEAEVHSAIEIAAAQFVYELPFGLQTRIGEQGMSLSGGQRQRLSLARAILAKPRVLVLDDTLSALDVHTEAVVTEALRRVLGAVTGIVVAHRASTLLLADKVALLDTVDGAGTITHIGTHEELLATVPRYRYLLAADDELDDGAEPRAEWEDEADRKQLDHLYEESVGQRAAARLPDGYIAAERSR
jgi:ATP-binding cassette subfamily B protein